MTQLASDSFNRADNTTLGGANWTVAGGATGDFHISANEAQTVAAPSTDYNTAATWPADQYAEITVGSVVDTTTDTGVGPAVRINTSGAQTLYLAQTNTHETRLYKAVAGTFTQLGTDGPACAAGDVLRIEVQGTSISVKKNGSTIIGPVTDSSIASGSAGMWGFPGATSPTINAWAAGDFTAADQPPASDYSADFFGDDFASEDAFVIEVTMQAQAPVIVDVPAIADIEWDSINVEALYEEPTLDTYEWSNPLDPNAPPNGLLAPEHAVFPEDFEIEDFFPDDFGNIDLDELAAADTWSWHEELPEDLPPPDQHALVDSVPASPQMPEDAFGHFDEFPDDDWHVVTDDDDDAVGINVPALYLFEDGWNWLEIHLDDQPLDETRSVGADFVPPSAMSPPDSWPHDEADDQAPLIGLIDDSVVGPDAPPPLVAEIAPELLEDAADGYEELFTDVVGADLAIDVPPHDGWDWIEPQPEDVWVDESPIGSDYAPPPSQFTHDAWDWDEFAYETDDRNEQELSWVPGVAAAYRIHVVRSLARISIAVDSPRISITVDNRRLNVVSGK